MFGKDLAAHITAADGNTPAPRRFTHKPDAIFTWSSGDGVCCSAVNAGMQYGINSSYHTRACRYSDTPKHRIVFVDQPFRHYDHAKHLDVVAAIRPRYATVQDIMTRDQCAALGIHYTDPDIILRQAEDLATHAKNVIVIPKAPEFFSLVPSRFMLGYPVPSSYSDEAPPPLDLYRGRRVHLLGGSWSRQLSLLYTLGGDVVSLDTNYIHRIARYGTYIDPAGQTHALRDALNFHTTNTLLIALSISAGSIVHAIDRLASAE